MKIVFISAAERLKLLYEVASQTGETSYEAVAESVDMILRNIHAMQENFVFDFEPISEKDMNELISYINE